MRTVNPEETNPPYKIWQWVWDTLEEISDEVGVEKNGKYLLAYEGWGGLCVSKVFESTKSDEENEDAYYRFAEKQSNKIINGCILKKTKLNVKKLIPAIFQKNLKPFSL